MKLISQKTNTATVVFLKQTLLAVFIFTTLLYTFFRLLFWGFSFSMAESAGLYIRMYLVILGSILILKLLVEIINITERIVETKKL